MERSVTVEENHPRSDSTPLTKSTQSLIMVESISIDLTAAMEDQAKKCEHFSIRGYAAEMRKKDPSICLPFAFHGKENKSEEKVSLLPPLHVPIFRRWCCQKCVQGIGPTSATEEVGVVPYSCKRRFVSGSTSSRIQCPIDVEKVLSDSQQVPELENSVGSKADVDTSTNVNRDEAGEAAMIGCENDAENDVNHEIPNPAWDMVEYNPYLISKGHVDCPDALGSKISQSLEFRGPSCRNYAAADVENLERTTSSSAEICQMERLTSGDGAQRTASKASKTLEVVGKTNECTSLFKEQKTPVPSSDLLGHDNLSSESDDTLAENKHHDEHMDNPSGLIRQKTRKVRLLTELLGSKAENAHIRTEGGSSSRVSDMPAGLDSISTLSNHMAVQGSHKTCLGSLKGKRKMPQDKGWKSQELIGPSKLAKKARGVKGDPETTNMSIINLDSDSEEDAYARVDLQASVWRKCAQQRSDRNSGPGKNKNKLAQHAGGFSTLRPQEDFVSETNQMKIGDAEGHSAAADGNLFTSAPGVRINSRMEPRFKSSFPPQQTKTKYSLCKKKNKQAGDGQEYSIPQRIGMFGEGSTLREKFDIMQTEHDSVILQSAHDATAGQCLDLSLPSYAAARKDEKNCTTQTTDCIDPLFPQQKGTLRENHQRKGLLCDLNEDITGHRTSLVNDRQDPAPQFPNGNFNRHQHLNLSGSHNNLNSSEVQEQGNDDIPMEIVELLAKNQYERFHLEAEKNGIIPEQAMNQRNATLNGFTRLHENGGLKPIQEQNRRMKKSLFGIGRFVTGENVAPSKRNPMYGLPETNGDHFNMGQQEGNSAFAGFTSISRCRKTQSGGVQTSFSGFIRNGNPQSSKRKGKLTSRFSPIKLPVLNSCQIKPRPSEEAEHLRSPLIQNHAAFGLNMPQKYTPQSSNLGLYSHFPETMCEGRMTRDLDLNFMNRNANNLEKKNTDFGSESSRKASAGSPSICRHSGIDLNAKLSEPSDLNSNETIPAMQLLSLGNAGMPSSSAFSLCGNPKFFAKPLVPCDHHPKVSLDVTSIMLEKLPYDHHSKESSSLGAGIHNVGSKQLLSGFYGKNPSLGKSCQCSHVDSAGGTSATLFQNDGNSKRRTGFTSQVLSQSEEQGEPHVQKRGRRSQKSAGNNGASHLSTSNTIEDKQKGPIGASDATSQVVSQSEERGDPVTKKRGRRSQKCAGKNGVSHPSRSSALQDKQKGLIAASSTTVPFEHHRTINSSKSIDLEASSANGTIASMRNISENETCTLNRNPADFSTPEARNEYMISGRDLKFGKEISSRGSPRLKNVDGQKRRRITKVSDMEGQ